MAGASIFKKNKNIEKGLQNRRRGLMRKADDVQRVYGIGVAVLMEINGEFFQYESRTGFLTHNKQIPAKNQFSPANVLERNSRLSSATPSPKQTKPTASQHATKERRKYARRTSRRKSDIAARTGISCHLFSRSHKEVLRSVAMVDLLATTYFDKKRPQVVAPTAGSSTPSDAESATPAAPDNMEAYTDTFPTSLHSL